MPTSHLTKAELVCVLDVIHASTAASTDEDVQRIIGRLADILPYQAALTAVSTTCAPGQEPLVGLRIVNADYPSEYLSELGRRGLVQHDPVLEQHWRTYGLQHWADTFGPMQRPLPRHVDEILGLAEDFGFKKVRAGCGYAHGLRNPVGSATFFCFHGLTRCGRTEEILELVVPHLHQALCRSSSRQASCKPLSDRELEVMRWVKEGKTTWDISMILSISERTVKFHVANIIRKLGASTRAHAVAIAVEQRLFDLG